MKSFFVFIICFLTPVWLNAYEPAIDFDEVKKGYDEGKYDHILSENEFLCHSWFEKGHFDEYIANRKDSIHLALQKYRLAKEAQEKNKSKLLRLEKNKERALYNICEYHPNLRISRMVKNILEYDKLSIKHKDALDYMAFLEFGAVDVSQDSAAFHIQKMMFDYTLRFLVVSSLLIDGKISPGTAHMFQVILEFDKARHLRELCDQHPESYASIKCLEAMDVTQAMLPVAYDKKYLGDLLVGLRAPENGVEGKVCRILKDAYIKKMELLGSR